VTGQEDIRWQRMDVPTIRAVGFSRNSLLGELPGKPWREGKIYRGEASVWSHRVLSPSTNSI